MDLFLNNSPNSFLYNNIANITDDHSSTPFTSDKYGPIPRYYGDKKNGIVVFLDVLGMKKIWERLGYSEVIIDGIKLLGNFC